MIEKAKDVPSEKLGFFKHMVRVLMSWIPRPHNNFFQFIPHTSGHSTPFEVNALFHAPPQPQQQSAATASVEQEEEGTDLDESFQFLDDVIAGKHEELLKEMNRQSRNSAELQQEAGTERIAHVQPNSLGPMAQSPREAQQRDGLVEQIAPPYASPASSAARLLTEYELIAYIGSGSFAEVTLARHRSTQEHYALKKISKSKVQEEGCVQSTIAERHMLVWMQHPFIVGLHQAFQGRSYLYLLLDFAQGGDMYNFLKTKPWVRDMKRKIFRQKQRWNNKGNGRVLVSIPSFRRTLSGHRASATEDDMTSRKSFHGTCGCEAQSTGGPSIFGNTPQWETADGSLLPNPTRATSVNASPYAGRISPCQLPHLAPDESRMPIRLVAFYAVEIALALEYLHEKEFLYRDLKPENILMKRDGHVMLTDFGVAKFRGRGMQRKQEGRDSFAGTPQYMSPEMHRGELHDARADWWSFGCILFEMANGRRAFEAKNQFAVIQAIVEQDVAVRPLDFKPTGLEMATRVVQLHRHYLECHQYVRQLCNQQSMQRARPRVAENNSAINTSRLANGPDDGSCGGLDNISLLSDPQPAPSTLLGCSGLNSFHFGGTSPQIETNDVFKLDSITIASTAAAGDEEEQEERGGGGVGVGGGGGGTATVTSGLRGAKDTRVGGARRPMSEEEHNQYVRHATDELNEAFDLLRDLILSLLERRVERRISGPSVLEHPFFSCSYVASQLYHRCKIEEDIMSTRMSCGSAAGSLGPAIRRFVEESLFITALSPRATCHTPPCSENENVGNTDEDDLEEPPKGNECLDSPREVEFDVKRFLSLARTTRPEAWRTFFCDCSIVPLYIPRLLAPDDLRYFPSAVTATGDSVIEQQRVLRRSGHRSVLSTGRNSPVHSGRSRRTAMGRKSSHVEEEEEEEDDDEDVYEDALPCTADTTATSARSDKDSSRFHLSVRTSEAEAARGAMTGVLLPMPVPMKETVRSHSVTLAEDLKEVGSAGLMREHTRRRGRSLHGNDHDFRYTHTVMDNELVNDHSHSDYDEDGRSKNTTTNNNKNEESGMDSDDSGDGGDNMEDPHLDTLGAVTALHKGWGIRFDKSPRPLRKPFIVPELPLSGSDECNRMGPNIEVRPPSLIPVAKRSAPAIPLGTRDDTYCTGEKPMTRAVPPCRQNSSSCASLSAFSVGTDDDESCGSVQFRTLTYNMAEPSRATLHGVAYDVDDYVPRRAERQLNAAIPFAARGALPGAPPQYSNPTGILPTGPRGAARPPAPPKSVSSAECPVPLPHRPPPPAPAAAAAAAAAVPSPVPSKRFTTSDTRRASLHAASPMAMGRALFTGPEPMSPAGAYDRSGANRMGMDLNPIPGMAVPGGPAAALSAQANPIGGRGGTGDHEETATGGGAQHYMDFTFDGRSGRALLAGAGEGKARINFSEIL